MIRFHMLCLTTVLMTLAGALQAQTEAVNPDDVVIEVRGWDVSVVRYEDVYPDVANISEGGKLPWLRFIAEYTVTINPDRLRRYNNPEDLWLDALQLDWSVILAPVKNDAGIYNDRRAVRMSKSVSYANIDVSKRKYFAVIYVEPRVLRRYAREINSDDMFVRLRFRVGRKTRGEMAARGKRYAITSRDMRELRGEGPRGDLFQSEVTIRPPVGLMNRYETPWEWSSYDSFETIIRDHD